MGRNKGVLIGCFALAGSLLIGWSIWGDGGSGSSAHIEGGEDARAAGSQVNIVRPKRVVPATREEAELQGAEALARVLGGGAGGFDSAESERDEEQFPPPETLEEAQTRMTEALEDVERALAEEAPITEERRRALRNATSLALSDLTEHLDLSSEDGKSQYFDARSQARGALMDLKPLKIEYRDELLATRGSAANE